MNPAGQLTVRGRLVDGQWADLQVDLQRPSVTRLFIGQLPEAVVKTMPYLFTLCAHAQRAAAQAALAAAAGEAPRVPDYAELWVEVLHENLWRLLLDWPHVLGEAPEREAFITWRNARQGADCVAATQALWARVAPRVTQLCEQFPFPRDNPGVHLPELAPQAWLAYWQGMADDMPVSPWPASIRSALAARVAEVERAIAALTDGRPFPIAHAGGEGWGIGQTLTARGVLTHAVHVVDGVVANYCVQAPTDRYFADAAPLVALLAGQRFTDPAQGRRGLEQAILALDPCLPYTLELHDA